MQEAQRCRVAETVRIAKAPELRNERLGVRQRGRKPRAQGWGMKECCGSVKIPPSPDEKGGNWASRGLGRFKTALVNVGEDALGPWDAGGKGGARRGGRERKGETRGDAQLTQLGDRESRSGETSSPCNANPGTPGSSKQARCGAATGKTTSSGQKRLNLSTLQVSRGSRSSSQIQASDNGTQRETRRW